MQNLAIKKTLTGNIDQITASLIEAIKPAGFGILTRIDFDQKIKEKLGHDLPKTIILGACNPKLAYDAYQQTTDVALLIPCNIVVREIGNDQVVVEAMRPSAMLSFLSGVTSGKEEIIAAENKLSEAIASL